MTASAPSTAAAIEFRIAQVGLHQLDLADDAERAEEAGEVGPSDRDPDAPAVARQRPDDVPADEAGAAENDRQTIGAGREFGHLRVAPAGGPPLNKVWRRRLYRRAGIPRRAAV